MGFYKSAQFTLNVFEIRWLPCSISKDQAKIRYIKIYNEISIIIFYGAATIEEHGKISPCYKKNISQDTTCRKILVVDCAKKVLGGFGLTEVCSSVANRFGAGPDFQNGRQNLFCIINAGHASN